MEGEELLVGAYHTYPMAIGTAMGIVPMGKGSVSVSYTHLSAMFACQLVY